MAGGQCGDPGSVDVHRDDVVAEVGQAGCACTAPRYPQPMTEICTGELPTRGGVAQVVHVPRTDGVDPPTVVADFQASVVVDRDRLAEQVAATGELYAHRSADRRAQRAHPVGDRIRDLQPGQVTLQHGVGEVGGVGALERQRGGGRHRQLRLRHREVDARSEHDPAVGSHLGEDPAHLLAADEDVVGPLERGARRHQGREGLGHRGTGAQRQPARWRTGQQHTHRECGAGRRSPGASEPPAARGLIERHHDLVVRRLRHREQLGVGRR